MPTFANILERKQYKKKISTDIKNRGEKKKVKDEKAKKFEESISVPRSLVYHKGNIGKQLSELEENFKKYVMMPYTAAQTSVTQDTSANELVKVAKDIGVSHLLSFVKGDFLTFFRIIRAPAGPTIEFTLEGYTTQSIMERAQLNGIEGSSGSFEQAFTTVGKAMVLDPPFLVMSNFKPNDVYHKLLASSFQNMFPEIDVDAFTKSITKEKLKLSNRRVLMINYNGETDCFEWRHYVIKEKENLGIEEEIQASSPFKKIGLSEIGPRMNVKLHKIEEGIMGGEVLYHADVKKSPEEIIALRKKKEEKETRRKQQEKNVEAKKIAKEQEKDEKRKDKNEKKQKHTERFEKAITEEPQQKEEEEDNDENLVEAPTKKKRRIEKKDKKGFE